MVDSNPFASTTPVCFCALSEMRLSRANTLVLALAASLGASACKRSPTPSPTPTPAAEVLLGGDRRATVVHVPSKLDPTEPLSVVILLHGYGSNAQSIDSYLNLASLIETERIVVIAPDGTEDRRGNRFWNATDTCCDFEDRAIDDVAYLTGLVKEVKEKLLVDPRRVYAVGHSNGGGMALRLACDAANTFAAVVDLAGAFYSDFAMCKPTEPVAIRHMHGTGDAVVPYIGGPISPRVSIKSGANLPTAPAIATAWAAWNGCNKDPDTLFPALDLDRFETGAETKVSKYTGCKGGADVELYTMVRSSHSPTAFQKDFIQGLWDFLKEHPKH